MTDATHPGYPEFVNTYLIATGWRWPGDTPSTNFWVVHPDGNNYNGPFDSHLEAVEVALASKPFVCASPNLANLLTEAREFCENYPSYGAADLRRAWADYNSKQAEGLA